MFSWLKKLFHRDRSQHTKPQRLAVGGVPAVPITPEPDDAELATETLLDVLERGESRDGNGKEKGEKGKKKEGRNSAYYNAMAERIKNAQAIASFRATRFVAWCEERLKSADIPVTGPGSLQLMEAELYKRTDTIEREGGTLKRRWQHCLAEVTVRLMKLAKEDSEEEEIKEQSV